VIIFLLSDHKNTAMSGWVSHGPCRYPCLTMFRRGLNLMPLKPLISSVNLFVRLASLPDAECTFASALWRVKAGFNSFWAFGNVRMDFLSNTDMPSFRCMFRGSSRVVRGNAAGYVMPAPSLVQSCGMVHGGTSTFLYS